MHQLRSRETTVHLVMSALSGPTDLRPHAGHTMVSTLVHSRLPLTLLIQYSVQVAINLFWCCFICTESIFSDPNLELSACCYCEFSKFAAKKKFEQSQHYALSFL